MCKFPNVLCFCCSQSTAWSVGLCCSRFPWFSQLVLLLGHAWYWYGAFVFFLSLFSLSDDSVRYPAVICYTILYCVIAAQCVRVVAEMCARWTPRAAFAMGAMLFVSGIFLAAYTHSNDHYMLFYAAAPCIGAAIMLMDVSTRQVTADQTQQSWDKHLALSYTVRFCAALVAGVYMGFAMQWISWKQHFYVYAFLSIGTLSYVAWFMPGRRVYMELPAKAVCSQIQRHRFVVVVLIEMFVSGLRWAVPLLLVQSPVVVFDTDSPDPSTNQYILVVYMAAATLNDLAQVCLVRFKWNVNILSYMVAAVIYVIVCFSYPSNTSSVSTWNVAVFTGLFGYGTDNSDGIIRTMYGVTRTGGVRAAMSWLNAASTALLLYFVCDQADKVSIPLQDWDSRASTLFRVIGYCNFVVFMLLLYLHFGLNQRRSYSRLTTLETKAKHDEDAEAAFSETQSLQI